MISDEQWAMFWVIVGIGALALVIYGASYWGGKHNTYEVACARAGGVSITIQQGYSCAHIDRFIELPGLQP